MKSEKYPISNIEKDTQIGILTTTYSGALQAAKRAAYCHRVFRILKRIPLNSDKKNITRLLVRDITFNNHLLPGATFCVRVHRIQNTRQEYETLALEAEIGAAIKRETTTNSVDLEHPNITFILLFSKEEAFFGIELYKRPRGVFIERNPNERPFYMPGTLEPQFARLLANLARCSPDNFLLDPFCGPGGILIEGAVMGCKVIGNDLNEEMTKGAKQNIQYYAPKVFPELIMGDARTLPLRSKSINAIATDPPYGRVSSSYGNSIPHLLEDFLGNTRDFLADNALVAIAMTKDVPIKSIIESAGYEILHLEDMFIHGSLTRRIGVCKVK
ncbi:MAG: THUMP domain-containing protein [Asgard group archaeon]|nr:THUMP domain-containing protein [Asgard group archaeon]